MKILSVTKSIPEENDAWCWRISNIVRLLRAGGHDVHIIYYVRGLEYKRLENKVRYGQDSFVLASIATAPIKHLRVLLKGKYDLVYGNTSWGTFYSLLGKLIRIPLIFDKHGDPVEEFLLQKGSDLSSKISPEFFLNKFIEFMDIHLSDKILCVSKNMIAYLHEKKGVPLEKMAYVTNGVDLEFFKPLNEEKVRNMRAQLKIENKLVFGYVGNFQKWQGVENFIEAARNIEDREIAFLIIGGKEKSKEHNITFIPKVPRAQIPDYYSSCDVLVLPRPSHPATEIAAPTKFAEYVAMGKPILTADVGDAAEFVRDYNCGIVVEDNEVENLIKGVNEFSDKSETELKEMGINSRKLAEKEFDWEKVDISLLEAVESLQ